MVADLVTLAVIALAAFLCPLISQNLPGKVIPETVFLLIAGMLLGPHMAGVIEISDSVSLLSDLGLAFLFLLAGYEIDPDNLTGKMGRRGAATWIITLAIAFVAVVLWPQFSILSIDGIAVAIALTTTALGTLLPILQERGLMSTRVGNAVLAYGTWGELGPIVAMALLLSTRARWETVLILGLFTLIAVLFAVLPKKARRAGSFVVRFVTRNADTNAQMLVRAVMVLLVGLTALSAVFDLDVVLGAFAAGFVLRYVIPEGSDALENKLNAIAYGFFIPLFFIVSGAKIDMTAVFAQPLLLVEFIVLLLLVRAVPIYISLRLDPATRGMTTRSRLSISLYCTTALPLIVAVTSVATSFGAMSDQTASVLVAAGGITVLVMPLLAQVLLRATDAELGEAIKEIAEQPRDTIQILRDHHELERMIARQNYLDHQRLAKNAVLGEEVPWQDRAALLQRHTERNRARDAALDEAAQAYAASHADDPEFEEVAREIGKRVNRGVKRARRIERRRRAIADVAVRNHARIMREMAKREGAAPTAAAPSDHEVPDEQEKDKREV